MKQHSVKLKVPKKLLFLSENLFNYIYMIHTHICVYIAHHFILVRLNPFDLRPWFRVDREGWWFEHSASQLQACLSAEGAKNVSWPWLSFLRGLGSLTMSLTGKFVYIWLTISSCCGSIPLTLDLGLGLIGRDGGLSTLCHSLGFACQQGVLKTFAGPGYWLSPLRGCGSLTDYVTYWYKYIFV